MRWLKENRGALTDIATRLSLSKPFVSDVFWDRKRSADAKVERELSSLGAPGFAREGVGMTPKPAGGSRS